MDRDTAADLGFLARQFRFRAEFDQALGISVSPYPTLEPFKIEAPAKSFEHTHLPPKPTSRSQPARSQRVSSGVSRERRLPVRSEAKEILEKAEPSLVLTPPKQETQEQLEKRREESLEALRNLYRKMVNCTLCRLHKGRTKLVFGQGDAAAELMFLGEGPGYNEDKQGLAFCGPSGDLLTRMIGAMGLDREDVFIANVVKCRPPSNRAPQPDEMGTCLPFLEEQLSIIRPRVIVALGKTAGVGLGLLRPDESLGRNRGFQHRWHGIRVMLTYHPAYLLRNESAKKLAWHDLKQVIPYLRRRRPERGARREQS